MTRKHLIIAIITLISLTAIPIGAASAIGAAFDDDDETEVPITGTAFSQASAAALAHTGEGRVTETEIGDEESYYEVEVSFDDGSQVDVQLDRAFVVVSSTIDHDEPGDTDDTDG